MKKSKTSLDTGHWTILVWTILDALMNTFVVLCTGMKLLSILTNLEAAGAVINARVGANSTTGFGFGPIVFYNTISMDGGVEYCDEFCLFSGIWRLLVAGFGEI
eukprot:scaffold35830_cov19-Cyclotella_meneghiniana.AAC.1